MKAAAGWLMVLVAVGCIALSWGARFNPIATSVFGIQYHGRDGLIEVRRAYRGTAAARAGIQPGDVLDLRPLSLAQRYRLGIGSPPGTRLTVGVTHDGHKRDVTLVAARFPQPRFSRSQWGAWVAATISLSIFALLGLRRPSLLTALLLFYGCGALNTFWTINQFSQLPDPLYVVAAVGIEGLLAILPVFALLSFIARFPEPPSNRRERRVMHLADSIFAVAAAIEIGAAVLEPLPLTVWKPLHDGLGLAGVAFVVLLVLWRYRIATGEARQRLGWVSVGIVVSTIAFTIWNVGLDALSNFEVNVVFLLTAAVAVSVGYAVLRHRVIDVGFALNRASGFALTTAVLVALFAALQWTANVLLARMTATSGLVVQTLIAIALVFAFRFVRSRSERFVAALFFSARNRRIAAIREIAIDLESLVRTDDIVAAVVPPLQARADIAARLEWNGSSAAMIDAAASERGMSVAVGVRGRRRGTLTCEPSATEDFAPDERAALRDLAQAIAITYDDLTAEALRLENERLQAALATGARVVDG